MSTAAPSTVTVAGTSLQALAAQVYGDPSLWTVIAAANGLTDPQVNGITTLVIPPGAYKPPSGGVRPPPRTKPPPVGGVGAGSGGGGTAPPSTTPPANALLDQNGNPILLPDGSYILVQADTPPADAVLDPSGDPIMLPDGSYLQATPATAPPPVVVTPNPPATPAPIDPTPVVLPTGPYLFLTSAHPHVIIEAQDGHAATIRVVRPFYLNTALFDVEHRNTPLSNNNTFWGSTFGYLTIQAGRPAVLRDITSLDDGTYSTTIFQGMSDGSFLQLALTWKVSPSATGTPPSPSQPIDPQTVVFYEDFAAGTGTGALSRTYDSMPNGSPAVVNTGGTLRIMGRGSAMTQTSADGSNSPAFGLGNGLFEFRCKYYGANIGDGAGPAIILWPSSDKWPGPEVDLGELMADGTFYMAPHWKDPTLPVANNGQNQSHIYPVPKPHDHTQWHTYAARLQTDKITFYVDGVPFATETAHPAPDFAHGGENHTVGLANDSTQTGIECDWIRWTPEAQLPPL